MVRTRGQRYEQVKSRKCSSYELAVAYRADMPKGAQERIRIRRRADRTFDVVLYRRLPEKGEDKIIGEEQ